MEIKVTVESPQLTTALMALVTLMEEMHLKGNGFVVNHVSNGEKVSKVREQTADSLEVAKEVFEATEVSEPAPKEFKEVKLSIKMEDVRAKLGELTKAGFKAEVKALFKQFGADKLSEVDPSSYAELLAKAGEIA